MFVQTTEKLLSRPTPLSSRKFIYLLLKLFKNAQSVLKLCSNIVQIDFNSFRSIIISWMINGRLYFVTIVGQQFQRKNKHDFKASKCYLELFSMYTLMHTTYSYSVPISWPSSSSIFYDLYICYEYFTQQFQSKNFYFLNKLSHLLRFLTFLAFMAI